MQLPYEIASSEEMTFAAWVNWRSTSTPKQRLFDFGNGPGQYAYLTPSNGNGVAFVINDGNGEQVVESTTKLPSTRWKHVAVTISKGTTSVEISMVEGNAADAGKSVSESIESACIIFATLPILVVYPFVQKYFVQGATIGAVKG